MMIDLRSYFGLSAFSARSRSSPGQLRLAKAVRPKLMKPRRDIASGPAHGMMGESRDIRFREEDRFAGVYLAPNVASSLPLVPSQTRRQLSSPPPMTTP